MFIQLTEHVDRGGSLSWSGVGGTVVIKGAEVTVRTATTFLSEIYVQTYNFLDSKHFRGTILIIVYIFCLGSVEETILQLRIHIGIKSMRYPNRWLLLHRYAIY